MIDVFLRLFDTPTVDEEKKSGTIYSEISSFFLHFKRRVLLLLLDWQQPKKIEGHFSRL